MPTDEQTGSEGPAPGSRDAVREAVRLLTGERPEWLPDAEEWSLPEMPRPHDRPRGWLEEAAQLMVKWLDGYAPLPASTSGQPMASSQHEAPTSRPSRPGACPS